MNANAAWLLRLARTQRSRYLGAAGALVLGTLALYVPPAIVAGTIDRLSRDAAARTASGWFEKLPGGAYLLSHLWIAAAAVVVVTTIHATFVYFRSRFTSVAAENVARDLRDSLYKHLQHLPVAWHDKAPTGDTVQRCSSDVETVRLFYATQIIDLARSLVLLVTVIPFMLSIDWVMALVAISMLPLILSFAHFFFGRVQGSFKAMDEAEGAMTTVMQENLTGIRTVRAFARQDFERNKFGGANGKHRALNWRLFEILSWFWSISDLMCFTQLVLVVAVGAWRVKHDHMSIGTLFLIFSCVNIYLWPVRMMGRTLTETGKAIVAIGRIREVLDAPEEADPATPAIAPTHAKGRVEFAHVSFSHGTKKVLDDVSFVVEPGKTLGLLGPSGAGKSTIGQLLMRFYDVESGTISIDGVDISTLTRKDSRRLVSAVMQEPFLYGKSLTENIKLAAPKASSDEIVDVAETASVHGSIQRFENKYDTVVGERGVTLSGGQRQRVAIARALLKPAPVLLLDDALSAVDTGTERRIIDGLANRGERTTILIAHRLSTLRHADEILVLDHGRIVQRGTHDELVERPGLYRELWQIQSEMEPEPEEVEA